MRRAFLLLSIVGLAGCDSGEDPTPVSTFSAEESFHRQLVGRVRQGTEPVEGALVQVEPSAVFQTDANLVPAGVFPQSASTDANGAYRLPVGPYQYDLSVRRDREVFVFRGLGVRFFEPPLGADGVIRAFRARVVATTDPPPKPGNAVAFFVSGADAVGITGEPGSLDATFRRFDTTVMLHAVEYVARDGLLGAVTHGRTELRLRDGIAVSKTVPMMPIAATVEVVFEATPPPGYALEPLDIVMDLGVRTSSIPVKRVAPGVPFKVGIVLDARYTVHGRATLGGATSDSGRLLYNSFERNIPVPLPPPVSAEAPIDDDAPPAPSPSEGLTPVFLDAGGVLAARIAKGTIEHVLAPVSGDGPVIRVATSARTTTLPDVTRLGLPRPAGRYTWTMEHFATLPHIDNMTGADARVTPPSWRSAPRVIVLR